MARKCVNVAYTHTTFGNDTEQILNSHKFILPYFLDPTQRSFPKHHNAIMEYEICNGPQPHRKTKSTIVSDSKPRFWVPLIASCKKTMEVSHRKMKDFTDLFGRGAF